MKFSFSVIKIQRIKQLIVIFDKDFVKLVYCLMRGILDTVIYNRYNLKGCYVT